MNREKRINALCGWVITFLLSFGAVACLETATALPGQDLKTLALVCALFGALACGCFSIRGGGYVLLGTAVAAAWQVWKQPEILVQTFGMLRRLTTLYNNAYGWGIPVLLRQSPPVDTVVWPLGILGGLIALAAAYALCRGKGGWLAGLAASLPLIASVVVNDTVPREEFLYLWMLGMLLLILTQGLRRKNLRQGLELTALVALPGALALGLLFWLVPREGYDKQPEQFQKAIVNWVQELPEIWEDAGEDLSAVIDGTAQPSRVNLSTLGPRLERKYPVMDVTAGFSGTLYLRGQDYDAYDGSGWTASRHRAEEYIGPGLEPAQPVTIRTRRVRDVLYLPYYPEEPMDLVGGKIENAENQREYTISHSPLPENWRQIVENWRHAGGVFTTGAADRYLGGDRRYLTLPQSTLEWARPLADRIAVDARSATAVADAIGTYVRNCALYDLDARRMPGGRGDFAQWFLEEGEAGYCVHFATAATVLLRAAGIEARYVEGYVAQAIAGETVTVTADKAHAWAEYYEPVLGAWIVLEATPADLTEEETTLSTAGRPTETTTSPEETLPTRPGQYAEPTEGTGLSQNGGAEAPELPGRSPGDFGWVWWLMIPIGLVGTLELQRSLRRALRRRRLRGAHPNARALARWRELTVLWRLLEACPDEESEQLAQKAKFSRHTLTREELGVFSARLAQARASATRLPLLRRLLGRYIFAVI